MRLGPLVCGLLRPPLHEPGMIFNPGQHATGGYFLFGLHELGLTKISADPGQQFSTRAGSGNIPSNRLEQSVFLGLISLAYTIVACDLRNFYLFPFIRNFAKLLFTPVFCNFTLNTFSEDFPFTYFKQEQPNVNYNNCYWHCGNVVVTVFRCIGITRNLGGTCCSLRISTNFVYLSIHLLWLRLCACGHTHRVL